MRKNGKKNVHPHPYPVTYLGVFLHVVGGDGEDAFDLGNHVGVAREAREGLGPGLGHQVVGVQVGVHAWVGGWGRWVGGWVGCVDAGGWVRGERERERGAKQRGKKTQHSRAQLPGGWVGGWVDE